MKPKEYNAWEKMRAKGMFKYVIVSGAIAYGLPMFVIMTFLVGNPISEELSTTGILLNMIIWIVAGLAFGAVMWFANEHRFKKAKQLEVK